MRWKSDVIHWKEMAFVYRLFEPGELGIQEKGAVINSAQPGAVVVCEDGLSSCLKELFQGKKPRLP